MNLFVIKCNTEYCGSNAANVIAEDIEDAIRIFNKENPDKSVSGIPRSILSVIDKGTVISETTPS